MTKLNLTLADPNCDVKELFADFIYEYDNTLAKPVQIDVYSVQVWACGSIYREDLTLSEIERLIESEMELCNALIHMCGDCLDLRERLRMDAREDGGVVR